MKRALKLCLFAMIGLVVTVAGCASSPSGGGGDGDDEGTSRNVITMAQLDQDPTLSALRVIRKLKPTWLQRRGVGSLRSSTQLLVVIDNSPTNDLGILDNIRAGTLSEIRYMHPRQATLRYGTNASGGAILVTTRR